MRTTVNVSDHLLVEAKRLAAAEHTSLARIIEDSLRQYLAEHRARRTPGTPWILPMVDGGAPVAGIDLTDTSGLLDL